MAKAKCAYCGDKKYLAYRTIGCGAVTERVFNCINKAECLQRVKEMVNED